MAVAGPVHEEPGRHERPDNGYSSWLQFEDGELLVLDYTNQGVPAGQSHIVAGRLRAEDFERAARRTGDCRGAGIGDWSGRCTGRRGCADVSSHALVVGATPGGSAMAVNNRQRRPDWGEVETQLPGWPAQGAT